MTAFHRLDDAFLREIARQYNAHVAAGWPPVRAIAVSHGVCRETVIRWIGLCRRAGLRLEPDFGVRHHYSVAGEREGGEGS